MTRRSRKKVPVPVLYTEPVEAAKAADLRYVSDDRPGIRRRGAGKGFSYVGTDGRTVRDAATLARVRALAIPPAWTDVWVCPIPNGHLQATGRDARGRKQYRYHARWREVRDETKYGRMILFGDALPGIRARVARDMARQGMPRQKLLATIVRLLETTFIRVGNDEYARTNGSFGLTTFTNEHVEIRGARLRFLFRGKSGKDHEIELNDRRLAGLVRRCRELPGQDLFQYLDEAGAPQPISSADVNDYIRDVAGDDFTAKDFRTWAGTLLAASHLLTLELPDDGAAPKSVVTGLVAAVAEQLGNTVAVCRKCYIHPRVLEALDDAALRALWKKEHAVEAPETGLSAAESALVRFLAAQLQTNGKNGAAGA